MIYLLVLPMTFLGALGAFFFKSASSKISGILSFLTCKELYIGGAFYVSGAILNILLLRHLQYSILYPMSAITYVWTAVLSSKLLGERISKRKLTGIAAIFAGVVILAQ